MCVSYLPLAAAPRVRRWSATCRRVTDVLGAAAAHEAQPARPASHDRGGSREFEGLVGTVG